MMPARKAPLCTPSNCETRLLEPVWRLMAAPILKRKGDICHVCTHCGIHSKNRKERGVH
jgi:hypothetical protein